MVTWHTRQRSGWIQLVLSLFCFAIFGLLVIYEFRNGDFFEGNEQFISELENQKIIEAKNGKDQPGDWPQWRGPHRDGASAETGLLKEWPNDGPAILWRADVGEGYSSVAIAAGRAYTLGLSEDKSREIVFCWDAVTGKEIWKYDYEIDVHSDRTKYDLSQGQGPRSTPTIDGDRVYTVGSTGILTCLNALTGKPAWTQAHDLLKEFDAKNLRWAVSFSPLVEGDLLLTNPGGPDGNSLAAFNKKTGELAWKSQDDAAGYGSPLAVTLGGIRQVVFMTAKGLVSVSPHDGRLLWRFGWTTPFDVNACTPLIFQTGAGKDMGDYVFISSGYNKGCALVKIVTTKNGGLEARQVYTSNRMRNHFNSSVRHEGYLYGFDDARLTCLEIATGKRLWQQTGFTRGSLILADGMLIVLGETGQLALAEAAPTGFKQLATTDLFKDDGKRAFTPPTLAQGRLYLRDQKQVVCLELKSR